MYLHKKNYVGNKYRGKDQIVRVVVPKNQKGVTFPIKKGGIISKRISEIVEEVAYWRKANAIHKWFIDNCGEGEDRNDGAGMYVSKEQLEQLRDVCAEVLKVAIVKKGKITDGYSFKDGVKTPILVDGKFIENAEEVAELLPTESGFFFGNTEYNEYYLEDVKYTLKVMEQCLKEIAGGDIASYEYEASW